MSWNSSAAAGVASSALPASVDKPAPHWLFVDSGAQTGARNMRIDEERARALQSTSSGDAHPTLRLYRWNPWAISLGYHQSADDLDAALCAADGIDIVRRPTGGRAILHAEELTYCLVMETGRRGVLQVYNDISRALVRGLQLFGVQVSLQKSQPNFAETYRQASSIPCFTSSARYEIEWGGRKLVGSAQRRFPDGEHDVVLQHGSILCGPAHRRLVDYLRVADPHVQDQIRSEMAEKTVELSEILGAPPDLGHLALCLRRGFEMEWGIAFDIRPENQHAPYAEKLP
jgi:lipoyl(octanoyl) transferase